MPLGAIALLGALGLPSAPHVTFTRDVAPIIWSRCSTCHRPGEIGPFSLITYADVKRHAAQIADVTARRIMPPWKPEPGKGEFEGERRLTDRELQIIARWAQGGAPEGNRADLPPLPDWTAKWQIGTPDLVVHMPEPYRVPAAGGDVFRTFVVPIPTRRPIYVRALEFRPDNARVVHHANIGIDRTRSSRLLDEKDPEPGYSGSMVQDARYPEGQLLGWTPGQAAHPIPPGMQWRLEPNSDLVLQLHLQPTGRPELLTISVAFVFTEQPPMRTPLGLRLGSETIDIVPGNREYVVEDRYTLPADVDLIGIQPHAHYLARRMEATAVRPDGTREWLISIRDWDFRWQDVYRYRQPLVLPKGTVISMRFTYDNSEDNIRNPGRPPSHVVWGQNTSDEMGDLWLQLVPRNAADGATLAQDVRKKAHEQDLAAYTKLLELDPGNPLRHDAVANLHFEDGHVDEAIAEYVRSLELNPQSAPAHYNLGIAYSARGRRQDALVHFEEAVRLDADYAQAHGNLAALLQLAGRTRDALEHYERAITIRPDYVEARTNLAQLLLASGQPAKAAEQFRRALDVREDYAAALSGLAWLRATTFDAAQRDQREAVDLAERADRFAGEHDLAAIDALGAAYASAGRFEDAAFAAERGAALAATDGFPEIAARFRERLMLYKQRRPYLVPAPQ